MPELTAVMASARRLTRDLKALGASAPLRAAYEVSKRSGGHKLLFREVSFRPIGAACDVNLGAHLPSSEESRTRCLRDAQAVVTEGTRVFGTRASTGIHASWSTDPLTGKEWAHDIPWWEVDIRSKARLSDVKFVWEAGRHRDLVILARAAALEPSGPWLSQLEQSLERWFLECPPERGVHWYSSLELSMRAIAWAQVLALVGGALASGVRAGMEQQLVASARHIMIELPYTLSSMKNNHLLGDGLGLVMLSRLFPGHPGAQRWARLGDTLLLKQLRRHMHPDGSMIEDSLSYHRFVMEMLIVRHLLREAPAEVSLAMEFSALHLVNLGVLDGPIPQYGDWDEGRVLADSSPAGSVLGSALLALRLSGYRVEDDLWSAHDELTWYASPSDLGKQIPSPAAGAVRAGYFVKACSGDVRIWFKVAGGPSHQHADLTALWVCRGAEWIVEDPGTGTYNGPLEIRNGFRTSAAHDVWRPADQDQLRPHRAFRWLHAARGQAAAPLSVGDVTVLFATHDAFVESAPNARVARLVTLTPHGVTMRDEVEPPGEGIWQLTIPLGSDANFEGLFGVDDAAIHHGEAEPFSGWRSPTYGRWQPSRWASIERDLRQPAIWGWGERSAGTVGAEITWTPTGALARITIDGQFFDLEANHD